MSRTDTPAAKTARPRKRERVLRGIAVSPGIAIGPLFDATEPQAPEIPQARRIQASEIEAEAARLDAAVALSRKQLAKLKLRLGALPEEAQEELSPLLDAYAQMLGNSRLLRGARKRIAEQLTAAETAIADEADAIGAAIIALGGDDKAGLKRRADEVHEIARRLIRNLLHTPFRNFAHLPEGSILLAEALTPADAALIDPTRLIGVATDEGGEDGHTAIMLRALGIPTVLGASGLSSAARTGTMAVIDGTAGTVTLNPNATTLTAARRALAAFAREKQKLSKISRLKAETADQEPIDLQSNLEIPAELPLIVQAGAMGIGLLRSEFLFMNREDIPDEDSLAEVYSTVVDTMQGDPVTIRVLDWGGEKEIESLSNAGIVPVAGNTNPALGMRGIRMLLKAPELFETQLAAILRASTHGPVRVLLPMVTVPEEVREARDIYDRVVRRLRRRNVPLPETLPPLGIMIETPGAALAADALALEADFFAIGTNDLAMYALAVDRGDTGVAHLYDSLHPAVLRLVQFATEAALRMRMPVSICGEMASNPHLTPLLLGMGLRSFSMNASSLLRVKQAVRAVEIADCARFARSVMEQSDPLRIRELVKEFSEKFGL